MPMRQRTKIPQENGKVSLSLQVLLAQGPGTTSGDHGAWVFLDLSARSSKHTCTDTGRSRHLLSVSSHGFQDSWPWGLPPWPALRGGGRGGGGGKAEAWAGPLGDRTPVPKAWTGGRSPGWLCLERLCDRGLSPALSATDTQVDDVRGDQTSISQGGDLALAWRWINMLHV